MEENKTPAPKRAEIIYGERAQYKTGMTLDELAHFVLNAYEHGAHGQEVVTVRTGWKAQVRRATVSIEFEPHTADMVGVLGELMERQGRTKQPADPLGADYARPADRKTSDRPFNVEELDSPGEPPF